MEQLTKIDTDFVLDSSSAHLLTKKEEGKHNGFLVGYDKGIYWFACFTAKDGTLEGFGHSKQAIVKILIKTVIKNAVDLNPFDKISILNIINNW